LHIFHVIQVKLGTNGVMCKTHFVVRPGTLGFQS